MYCVKIEGQRAEGERDHCRYCGWLDSCLFFFFFRLIIDITPTEIRVLAALPELSEATRGGLKDGYFEWVTGRIEWMLIRELMGGVMQENERKKGRDSGRAGHGREMLIRRE
jgi:hypothetical protein